MADNIIKLRAEFEAADTVRKMEQLRKTASDIRKDAIIGSKEYVASAKLESEIKDKIYQQNQMAYSQNAKMKESYFALGHQLRANKFAFLEAAQAAGLDRTGLGGALMALTGPGGIVAGAVAAGTVWISNLHEQAVAATNAALAVDKYSKKLADNIAAKKGLSGARNAYEQAKFDLMTPEQQIEYLNRQIREKEALRQGEYGSSTLNIYGKAGAVQLDTEILQLRKKLLDVTKSLSDAEIQRYSQLKSPAAGSYGPQPGEGEETLSRWRARVTGSFDQSTRLGVPEGYEYSRGRGIEPETKKLSEFQMRAINVAQGFKAAWTDAIVTPIQTGSRLLDNMLRTLIGEITDWLFTLGLNAIGSSLGLPGLGSGGSILNNSKTGGEGFTTGRSVRQYGSGLGVQERLVGVVSGRNLRLIMIRENQVHNIAVI